MSFFYRSHTGKIFGRKVGSKIYDAVIYAIPTLFKKHYNADLSEKYFL